MRCEAGIVMSINKNKATLMTKQGEFIEVKLDKKEVQIGEEFSGKISESMPFYKYSFIAASILFMLFIGGGSYAYYTPVSDITVSINPQIKLQSNRWNKIIKAIPLNSDGEKVLKNINIKNKTLEVGLNLIVDEAKNENFINDDYIKNGKIIEVTVESKGNLKVDLSNFKSDIEKNNLKIKIKNSEEKTKNGNDLDSSKEKENVNTIENDNKIENSNKINNNDKQEEKDAIKKTDGNSNGNSSQNTNVKDKTEIDKKNNEEVKKNQNITEQDKKPNETKEDNKSKSENGIRNEEKKENSEEKNNNGNNNSKIKEETNKNNKEDKGKK